MPWKFTLLNETRLRGNATATQGGAAYVLSMVSTLRACQFQGIWDGKTQTPCLACMLHTAPWGSRLDKHGLSLAGMSVPGGLGQQILKTMLRRYEALGGAVALPLSKRGAGLLSMVFCAKTANPQELVAIEMGNQA